ncbi:hypothetical protein PF006_g29235 [Phytophthora fragariae]|uniref:Acyltransferase 3 domain-containing protein n=4 Tax=Phytophthora fragariae TaxID=53985 RepID=A0A6A3Q816_9STRA|nr:hypothetical protein PF006_g29235 [Phytophthora fragariae]
MLRSHGPDSDGTKTLAEDAAVATVVVLHVQSTPEDQSLLTDEQNKDKCKKPLKPKKAAVTAALPTKDRNLGAVGVDSFFALSSFLLTWLFTKKTIRMMNQGAGVGKWFFALGDYFSKRFCRVYPLFALTCPENFDLYKLLTFEFEYRYFVFWTLPLEISYYFFILVFVVRTLTLRKFWWVPFIPAYYWVLNEGWNDYRTRHSVMRRHISTFLTGSMAAVIFVMLDTWLKASGFRLLPTLLLRVVEFSALALFLSIAFHGLFFIWVHDNTVPKTPGFPFVSVSLTTVFVCEMMLPSALSSIFKWRFLRYGGNISF